MKIEIEKPAIPQFVADWIEQLYGQGFDNDDLLEALFSRNYEVAELRIFDWFADDKERAVAAILYGYGVEKEPLYYAKIKGWELATSKNTFWNYRHIVERPILSKLYISSNESIESFYTIERWNELGINDTNADFEEVEVWEIDLSESYKKDGENGK